MTTNKFKVVIKDKRGIVVYENSGFKDYEFAKEFGRTVGYCYAVGLTTSLDIYVENGRWDEGGNMLNLTDEMKRISDTIKGLYGKPEPDDDEFAKLVESGQPTTLKDFLLTAYDIEAIYALSGEFRGARFYFGKKLGMKITLDTENWYMKGYANVAGSEWGPHVPPEIRKGISSIAEDIFEEVPWI